MSLPIIPFLAGTVTGVVVTYLGLKKPGFGRAKSAGKEGSVAPTTEHEETEAQPAQDGA
jgi:hypothetical protein